MLDNNNKDIKKQKEDNDKEMLIKINAEEQRGKDWKMNE